MMKKLTKSAMALAALLSLGLPTQAQVKQAVQAGLEPPTEAPATTIATEAPAAITDGEALEAGKDYTSGWPLTPDADRMAYGRFVLGGGSMDAPRAATAKAPRREADGEEQEEKVWKYTGFNTAAGMAADGVTPTGGMVNFNISSTRYGAETNWQYEKGDDLFECDTVSSAPYLSPYSFEKEGRLYCFLPRQTQHWTGAYLYPDMTVTVYDALSFEQLEQQTVEIPGQQKGYVPWVLTYDSQYGNVYAISFSGTNEEEDATEHYYLSLMDQDTWQLKRLGRIDQVDGHRVVPRGLCCNYGTIYVNYTYQNDIYLGRMNTKTMAIEEVGKMGDVQGLYTIGSQPMIYDTGTYKLLYNHYDMEHAGQFFLVNTYAPSTWDAEQGKLVVTGDIVTVNLVNTTEHIQGGTSYSMFYQRPTASGSATEKKDWGTLDDLEISVNDETEEITVSFTLPEAKFADGTDFAFESYNYKKVAANFATSNQGPIYPSGYWSNLEYGDKVEKTFQLNPGIHFISLTVQPSDYNIQQLVNPIVVKKTIFVGYDKPAAPGKATLTITDAQQAKVTWTAPTKSQFSDFGTTIDTDALTYTVVNDVTGDTIAAATTALEATETLASEMLTAYTYSITATANGKESAAATTNIGMGGKYAPMPYVNNFESQSYMNGWTIINANDDGLYATWTYNTYGHFVADQGGRENDDWLITPPVQMQAGKLYMLKAKVNGQGTLRVTYGNDCTAEAQANILDEVTATSIYAHGINYVTHSDEMKYWYVRPENDGIYYFGFHDYNAAIDGNTWSIRHVTIDQVAEPEAPAAVGDLTFTPAPKGELSGTLQFTLPTTDIEGNAISELTGVAVYDDEGALLAEKAEVGTGAAVELPVSAVWGWNQYTVVARNEQGEGYPQQVRKFVGPDKPKAPTGLKATWGEEYNELVLTWDAIDSEGENGGYVDPETVSYHIYKYVSGYPPYTLLYDNGQEREIEIAIMDASAKQDQYILAVDAINDVVKDFEYYNRNLARVGIVMGQAQAVPFAEPFGADGLVGDVYINKAGINGQAWAIDAGYYNANVLPQNGGAQMVFVNNTATEASGTFVSPILDFTATEHPQFRLWLNHTPNMPEEAYVAIEATTNGADFEVIAPQQKLTGNAGWVEHVFDLTPLAGKLAQVGVMAYLPNPEQHVFMDNWTIQEAEGNDLALAAISQPFAPVVGQTVEITATVTNMGAAEATDYSVMLTVDDEIVDELFAEEPLPMGASKDFTFSLPIRTGMDEIVYSAEVLFDGDTNEDNNYSTEVELTPTQINLPAPTNLQRTATALTWQAPEEMDGYEVTLDFESQPAFLTDNIAGWNTADVDGNLTMSFVQYYGNTWPYMNQPLAWMTWSNSEAGAGVLAAKSTHGTPYGDKCLIAWGNYGQDASGHSSDKADDDWFISPEVKGGTDFSFDACLNDMGCTLEVLTSSTDRDPASFTNKVTTLTGSGQMGQWTNTSVTLPDDAKYVALHVALNGFDILVDNVTYTQAVAPKLLGYNLYLNSIFDSYLTETTAPAAFTAAAVSAVYDLGESALCEALQATGINAANAADGQGQSQLFDLSGRRLTKVGRGVTIVRGADGKTRKHVVR